MENGEGAVAIGILRTKVAHLEDAIKLQAFEYERRLGELNHAQAKQDARNAEYISREAWEARNQEIESRLRATDKWLWTSAGMGITAAAVVSMLLKFFG